MRTLSHLVALFLACGLFITSGSISAQTQDLKAPGRSAASRGVIIAPGSQVAGLAGLQAGDTPALAGQRVKVQQVDPDVGLLVSSATLGDADLAQALVRAGLAAEVNQPRQVLP